MKTEQLFGIILILISMILFNGIDSLVKPSEWWVTLVVIFASALYWKLVSVGANLLFGVREDER